MPASRVFTIPASAPFLPTLIGALMRGDLIAGFPAAGDPLAPARATLYLPTRRACRLARQTFLDVTGGEAAILPRIAAIGDLDEDEIVFSQEATGGLAQPALELPPALGPLERRLLLAELVMKWANSPDLHGAAGTPLIANTPASALGLADDLARLIDDMTTRQVPWSALDTLVPDLLDPYWQHSLKFLRIAREYWPQVLREYDVIEPAARRDLLIEAEAKRLAASDAPVIAAGSTGSMPSTARLLATIAGLPHGAVVLPGLDMTLDEPSWRAIAGTDGDPTHDGAAAAGHPQFAMQALLARLKLDRGAVTVLAPSGPREAFVSEALRPAATTDQWRSRSTAIAAMADDALGGVAMIEAATAEDEALAVAVALREGAEEPGVTALVTPDRALARRVLAALERWGVAVDDSGGDALSDTSAGLFARLAALAALDGLKPVTLLALLKHPLFRLGAAAHAHARAIAALERAVLRGPRPRPGSGGLVHALTRFTETRDTLHRSDPRRLVGDNDLAAAQRLAERLAAALAPFEAMSRGARPLAELAAQHRTAIETLSRDDAGNAVALAGRDGEALALALDELARAPAAASLAVPTHNYAELFDAVIATRQVRRPEQPNVRVRILGPLEARLQPLDRVVLGGLNEGTWPPETRGDPWLSRPMRRQLGLNLPELRIGLTAHDFAQAIGARHVILSRAAKMAGAPAVTSRFVQRMAALAGETRWAGIVKDGARYIALAHALDRPAAIQPAPRPEPKPPLAARPKQLSVTAIENWLRDPYTIYAEHILKLRPLDAVDTPPGAADRGTVMHEAIGNFTKAHAADLPADAEAQLIALGQQSFAPLDDYPEARAFWWPRFLRIARWLVGWERERRPQLAAVYGEIGGKLEIPLGDITFTLTARADRIERRADGTYAIIDYKTGSARTEPQVRTGMAPQLTLEAAILKSGGFKDVPAGSVAELTYVTLKGGTPAGIPYTVGFKEGTPDSQADYARKRLTGIVAKFADPETGYASRVHPMWKNQYGTYDHLARVKEWSLTGGEPELDE